MQVHTPIRIESLRWNERTLGYYNLLLKQIDQITKTGFHLPCTSRLHQLSIINGNKEYFNSALRLRVAGEVYTLRHRRWIYFALDLVHLSPLPHYREPSANIPSPSCPPKPILPVRKVGDWLHIPMGFPHRTYWNVWRWVGGFTNWNTMSTARTWSMHGFLLLFGRVRLLSREGHLRKIRRGEVQLETNFPSKINGFSNLGPFNRQNYDSKDRLTIHIPMSGIRYLLGLMQQAIRRSNRKSWIRSPDHNLQNIGSE